MELDEKIERELSKLKLGTVVGEDEVVQCNTIDDMLVSDPPQERSKGVQNTRIRGHFEKRKTKPTKDASSSSEKLLLYFIFLLNICYIFITNRHFFCMISQEKVTFLAHVRFFFMIWLFLIGLEYKVRFLTLYSGTTI